MVGGATMLVAVEEVVVAEVVSALVLWVPWVLCLKF